MAQGLLIFSFMRRIKYVLVSFFAVYLTACSSASIQDVQITFPTGDNTDLSALLGVFREQDSTGLEVLYLSEFMPLDNIQVSEDLAHANNLQLVLLTFAEDYIGYTPAYLEESEESESYAQILPNHIFHSTLPESTSLEALSSSDPEATQVLNFANRIFIDTTSNTTPNHPPTVSLTADQLKGTLPLLVSFSCDAEDPDGDPLTYRFDFGEGDPMANASPNETHIFNSNGSYTVSCTVSDGEEEVTSTVTILSQVGLLAQYLVDGDLNDETGHGFDGEYFGEIFIPDLEGRAAVFFDGSDDYIELPENLDDGIVDFTFAAWVWWLGPVDEQYERIFDFSDYSNTGDANDDDIPDGSTATQGRYMYLTPDSRSGLAFSMSTEGYSSPDSVVLTGGNEAAPTPLETGQWVHVAVTLDGDTGSLYRNGVLEATGEILLNPNDLNTTDNWLGRSSFNSDPYFNGVFGEVRIYDRALSSSEIETLAND